MLTTWNAFPLLDQLLDDVMSGVGGTSLGTSSAARAFAPAVDVRVNETEIVVLADVPGVRLEDIEVTLANGVLSFKGRRQYEGNAKDKVWLGRSYGTFERSLTLPETTDQEQLSADLANGVLTVRIAQKPKPQPRKVPIGTRDSNARLVGQPEKSES